jgi:hypothetical protein
MFGGAPHLHYYAKDTKLNERSRLLISAIASAVLFSIGYLIVIVLPGGGTTVDQEFIDYYVDNEGFSVPFLLSLALLAAGWALIWFFTELRSRLPDIALTRVAYGVALVGVAGLVAGGVIMFAPAAVQMHGGAEFVGPPVAHGFAQAGLGVMLALGMYSLALAVGLFSFALRRAAVVPSWLSIAGIVVAVLMVGAIVWLPGYLLPIWVVAVGLVGVRPIQTT